MKLLIFAYILELFAFNVALELDEEYPAPFWPKFKGLIVNLEDEANQSLGVDLDSGCTCKQAPKMFTICFGIDFCVKFPKSVQTKEMIFKIRTTSIKEIKKGDLFNFRHLRYLEIDANFNLKTIQAGSFEGMTNLRNLSICFNSNLEHLEPDTFLGLSNLKELFLVKNGFSSLKNLAYSLTPNILPKLVKLKLNENNFKEIGENDLAPMDGSSLEDLSLILCQITYIHPKALLPLKKLNTLRLGENTFDDNVIVDLLNTTIANNITLQKLNLFGVGFRKKPPERLMRIIADSSVTKLSLAHNQFEVFDNSSFPPMPNLIHLDLRDVLALNVSKDTFYDMPNLRTLLLSGNKIPIVPEGVLLPQLHYLDLSSNSGDVYSPSYFTLGRNKFINMKTLSGLNLSFNNIHVIFRYSFEGLSNLRVLGLKNATIHLINNGTFAPLVNLIFLDLENNPFPKSNPFTKEIFAGLANLQVLLLGGCYISYLNANSNPFEYLTSLKHLGLERNYLKVLSPVIFTPLVQLKRLNLAQNFLTSWHTRLFKQNKLEQVIANQNKIIYFTEAMLQDFSNLTSMDLSKNPISCDCNLVKQISILLAANKNITILKLIEDHQIYCVFPDEFSNITVLTYYDMARNRTDLCPFVYSNLVIKYSLAVIVLCIFFIAILILTYKYRWHLRYWLFLTRIAVIRKGKVLQKRRASFAKEYEYDAFVSYSNEDRNFVEKLVTMLEDYEPYLKLCVYERDFEIGSVISENVLASVEKSRRTLLIVSNSYLRSQWCCWEAHVAENYRLFFQNEYGDLVNDSIVMVKLGKVSKAHMTPMLKYLLKTRIYLQWEPDPNKEKVFWERLRKALAPSKDLEVQ